MSRNDVINALLDAAKEKTGSDYKTAKLLDRSSQEISNWRHGHKNPQPEDHALVAALAGLDPEEALIRAVLVKHANTSKGERLLSVLGNVLHRTGAAVTLLLFASVGLVTTLGSAEARTTTNGDNVHRRKRMATIRGLSNAMS